MAYRLSQLTEQEAADARRLRSQGCSEGFIRGYLRAGRTFGFTQTEKIMTKKTTKTKPARSPRGKKPARTKRAPKRSDAPPASTTLAPVAPPTAQTPSAPVVRQTKFDLVFPQIKAAFEALPDPNKRPRGFAKTVISDLMAVHDLSFASADALYYKAVWEHGEKLGLTVKQP